MNMLMFGRHFVKLFVFVGYLCLSQAFHEA